MRCGSSGEKGTFHRGEIRLAVNSATTSPELSMEGMVCSSTKRLYNHWDVGHVWFWIRRRKELNAHDGLSRGLDR